MAKEEQPEDPLFKKVGKGGVGEIESKGISPVPRAVTSVSSASVIPALTRQR